MKDLVNIPTINEQSKPFQLLNSIINKKMENIQKKAFQGSAVLFLRPLNILFTDKDKNKFEVYVNVEKKEILINNKPIQSVPSFYEYLEDILIATEGSIDYIENNEYNNFHFTLDDVNELIVAFEQYIENITNMDTNKRQTFPLLTFFMLPSTIIKNEKSLSHPFYENKRHDFVYNAQTQKVSMKFDKRVIRERPSREQWIEHHVLKISGRLVQIEPKDFKSTFLTNAISSLKILKDFMEHPETRKVASTDFMSVKTALSIIFYKNSNLFLLKTFGDKNNIPKDEESYIKAFNLRINQEQANNIREKFLSQQVLPQFTVQQLYENFIPNRRVGPVRIEENPNEAFSFNGEIVFLSDTSNEGNHQKMALNLMFHGFFNKEINDQFLDALLIDLSQRKLTFNHQDLTPEAKGSLTLHNRTATNSFLDNLFAQFCNIGLYQDSIANNMLSKVLSNEKFLISSIKENFDKLDKEKDSIAIKRQNFEQKIKILFETIFDVNDFIKDKKFTNSNVKFASHNSSLCIRDHGYIGRNTEFRINFKFENFCYTIDKSGVTFKLPTHLGISAYYDRNEQKMSFSYFDFLSQQKKLGNPSEDLINLIILNIDETVFKKIDDFISQLKTAQEYFTIECDAMEKIAEIFPEEVLLDSSQIIQPLKEF